VEKLNNENDSNRIIQSNSSRNLGQLKRVFWKLRFFLKIVLAVNIGLVVFGNRSLPSYPQDKNIRINKPMDINNQNKDQNHDEIPDYQKRWSGLHVRQGDRIVEASAEDQSVAQSYPHWSDKGSISDGKRLTILTQKNRYRVNEEIRVIHVFESTKLGEQVYIMGPKPVNGEYLDGQLVTAPPPNNEIPWNPLLYDGATLPSPAVDYNYDITSYTFSAPGTHQIYWQLGSLKSNILTIEITK
jgi:hypothetical protein